jgi:hypothetical protein
MMRSLCRENIARGNLDNDSSKETCCSSRFTAPQTISTDLSGLNPLAAQKRTNFSSQIGIEKKSWSEI